MNGRRLLLSDHLARAAKPGDKEYQIHDRALAGFMLRVQPSGGKTWIYRRRVDGKPRRVTLGAAETITADEARAKAHAFLAAAAHVDQPSKPKGPRFAEMAKVYMQRRAISWKPSTRYTHECYLRSTLLPFFGEMRIDGITRTDVARWFHDYGRSRPGGANRALSVLRDLFYRARDWGMLDETAPNPAKGIKKNRQVPKGQLLNGEQLRSLGAVLDRYAVIEPDQTDMVRLILLTGCRSGEIMNLRWKEVKPDRLKLADSKTGPREVLLGKPASLILRDRQRGQPDDYVFPSPILPGKPRTTIRSFWRCIRTEAGLGKTRLHDLRHSYASHAVMQGEGLFMTGKLLGHRNASSTERYAHLDGQFLLDAAERIGREIVRRCQAA